MINAGAILVCALLKTLVKPEMTLAEKFDFTMNYFEVSVYLTITNAVKSIHENKKTFDLHLFANY